MGVIVIIAMLVSGHAYGGRGMDIKSPNTPAVTPPSPFDSLNIQYVGGWTFGPETHAVYGENSIVFMGAENGIYVLDVTDPLSPQKLSEISTRGLVYDIFHSDNKLYAACGEGGVEIWDVSTPESPERFGK